MKGLFVLCFIFGIHLTAYAGDPDSGYGTLIAIEITNNGKPTGCIGKLEYTGNSIDMAVFGNGDVLPEVCLISEKKVNSKGVHQIKCTNQYGTEASGTINFRDELHPKITLIRESGQVITNISPEGRIWQKKNIPNIYLGL